VLGKSLSKCASLLVSVLLGRSHWHISGSSALASPKNNKKQQAQTVLVPRGAQTPAQCMGLGQLGSSNRVHDMVTSRQLDTFYSKFDNPYFQQPPGITLCQTRAAQLNKSSLKLLEVGCLLKNYPIFCEPGPEPCPDIPYISTVRIEIREGLKLISLKFWTNNGFCLGDAGNPTFTFKYMRLKWWCQIVTIRNIYLGPNPQS
jgi:hypothetical protein